MFKVYYFKKLTSTNEKAKEFPLNSVIIAHEQTKGKGRFNRKWSSSKGGIYLSIVLPKISEPQLYTFIACLSALKSVRIKEIKIKWPNDLIYKKKKLCGILTESNDKKTIVGIGINTNNKVPKSLKAISLNQISNKGINNNPIIKRLLLHFEKYLKKSKKEIISDWKKHSFLGSKIKVRTLSETYSGTAYDIDKDYFLILKDKKGKKITIIEGDILIE